MGFDLAITCTLHMCPETGKPFYYGTDPETHKITKIYALPDVDVPEELRPSLQLRGQHLHAYIEKWDQENIYQMDADMFCENFITWEEFKASPSYAGDEIQGYWTQEDHDRLRQLLEWCAKQSLSFQVNWSY